MKYDPTVRTEIYYKKEQTFDKACKKLDAADIHERNKELIIKYQQQMFALGTKQYRVGKVTDSLRIILQMFINKPLDVIGRDDITNFVAQLNRHSTWSLSTKRDYARALKQFFNWYREEDPRFDSEDYNERKATRKFYIHLDKTVKTGKPRKEYTESDLISEDDVKVLIDKGCSSSMERALISFLHERPMRIGEVLQLRIRHIQIKKGYAMVHLPGGKTGPRPVPILKCLPYMEEWLQNHPFKDNSDSLLWVSTHNGHFGNPLRYTGIRRLLMRIFERAGYLKIVREKRISKTGKKYTSERIVSKKKNWHSHWFRHSRCTFDSKIYTEAVLCAMAGWTPGSKELRTYTHVGGRTIEQAFMEAEGLKQDKKKKPDVQHCSLCGKVNKAESRFCTGCGRPLDVVTLVEDEKNKSTAIEQATELLAEIMSDPKQRKEFERFRRKSKSQ